MDIVVVGSINMDLVVNVPRIPLVGETILGKDLNYHGGGKGANQALTAGKLGIDVDMIGKIGEDDYGRQLIDGLKSGGVNTEAIDISDEPTGMAFIKVDDKSNNNIVVYPGANNSVDIGQIKKYEDIIINSKICILQLEIPLETVEYVIELCYKNDVMIILNPAPAISGIRNEILSKIDLLIPNETELFLLIDEEFHENKIEEAMYKVKDMGVKELIVTLGKDGGAYIKDGEIKYYESIEVEAVDTTGAGDSFVGGIAAALVNGKSLEESIEYASYVSALTVTKPGAQSSLPSKEEVDNFIESRRIK